MTNFLGNKAVVHASHGVGSATDANPVALPSVDMQSYGARRLIAVVHTEAVSNAAAVMDVDLQTSDDNAAWSDVGSVAGTVAVADKLVAIEVDTNSAVLKRYVRARHQRKDHASTIGYAFYILGDLRVPGDQTNGDIVGAGVVRQTGQLS